MLITQGPSQGKKQWSFPLLWNSQATLRLSLYLPLPLLFPPSPSAVTEQTGQVINSGATTLNLSCRQGCFSSPFGVFRGAPATLGFRQTKHCKTVTEIHQTPLCALILKVHPETLDWQGRWCWFGPVVSAVTECFQYCTFINTQTQLHWFFT